MTFHSADSGVLRRRRARRDLLIAAAIAVAIIAFAVRVDLFETYVNWSRRYERWEVDELIALPVGLLMGATYYMGRRLRDLHRAQFEIEMLRRAGTSLIAAHDREAIFSAALNAIPMALSGVAWTRATILERDGKYAVCAAVVGHGASLLQGLRFDMTRVPHLLEQGESGADTLTIRTAELGLLARLAQRVTLAQEVLIVPIRIRGELRFGIMVGFRKVQPPSTRDALRVLADEMSMALEGAEMAEGRFRSLVEHSSDVITQVDAAGLVVYQSDAVTRIFGFPPSTQMGRPVLNTIHPEDAPRVQAFLDRLREVPGGHETIECRVRHQDGSWRVAENAGTNLLDDPQVRSIVLNTRDVTERHTAAEALRRSEARFRGVIEGLGEGLVITGASGLIRYVNPRLTEMTGYTADEMVGKQGHKLLLAEAEWDRMDQRFRERAEGRSERYEVTLRRRDGTHLPVEVHATPLRDETGQIVGAVGAMADISERRDAEERLRERESQLRQAQKMEAVGRLAGGIAHDFNNLLTAIQGFAQLAAFETASDDPRSGYLHEVNAAATRAAALTQQLLAFSRKQVLQPRAVDLNATIRDLGRMLTRVLGEEIELRTDLATGSVLVHADPGQLEQVIVNLVVNARDAMPGGGTLAIRTRLPRPACGEPPQALLEVSDTGHGMDAVTRERIWEPFFTTKEQGKGTGLGLSTVYGIVEQTGGRVEVESAPDQGSTFRVWLDLCSAPGPAAGEADQAAPPTPGAELILLVEDDDAVRNLAREVLRRHGYSVLDAANGEEALQRVRTSPTQIDLVLTDLVMPGMRGHELVRRLREDRPDLRALFMSGYTEPAVSSPAELERLGGVLVQKPFAPDALARIVRETLDRPASS